MGVADKGRLNQYLTSVREAEIRTRRADAWLDTPLPKISDADRKRTNRNIPQTQAGDYFRTVYDLIITPEVGLSRHYPLGPNFAHIVGYVGPVSDRDLNRSEDPDPLLRIPRFQIGKVGVEAKYEEDLRGRAGAKHVEVNAQGRVMRELERREGNSGRNLQITVDAGLQNYVQARLGEESASAVVMDCNSGDILAIASSPSYDPNKFVRGISFDDYGVLRDNDLKYVYAFASGTISNGNSKLTSLCNRIVAIYLPKRLMFLPGRAIYFLSNSLVWALISLARSALVTEPNNLSPDPRQTWPPS